MDDAAPPTALRLDGLAKRFGRTRAIDGVDLAIARDSFVALVGASGSGKSTLLKTINRLVAPDAGTILFEGEDVTAIAAPALRRRIGYVFQSIGLFPHMTVAENIGIGPRLARRPIGPERVAELLELVELEPAHAQRVGVARALAGEPQVLLMDEPFGALDPVTRDALGRKVRELHDRLGLTTLMVTHDMAEALLLADRVLVMAAGRIVADETPRALLAGAGGDEAQALVAVPRDQADAIAELEG